MKSRDDGVTRRTLLTSSAGGILLPMCSRDQAMGAEQPFELPDVYRDLGLRPLINAAGTITTLGGSLMPPEVRAAWLAAADNFVSLTELQDRVGARIATRLGVEAALVTSGAAGGILLGTAAAITARNSERIGQLPLSSELDLQVIRQSTHRDCYDNQVVACGVRLIDVTTLADLERAVSDQTVMMFSYNYLEGQSTISRGEWIDVARRYNIPTLLDAAADAPPVDALWKYNQMGYDMVVFSGGKALRGPQDTGLLLGRKELIEAAKRNTSPRCGTIGRGMKVSKEDMVAMWAAVERFVTLDHQAEQREWERRISIIEDALTGIPTVETRRLIPSIANHVPHLLILWDEQRLNMTPSRLKQRLADGDPSIVTARVHDTGDDGSLISVFMLKPGEADIVAARLQEILRQAVN